MSRQRIFTSETNMFVVCIFVSFLYCVRLSAAHHALLRRSPDVGHCPIVHFSLPTNGHLCCPCGDTIFVSSSTLTTSRHFLLAGFQHLPLKRGKKTKTWSHSWESSAEGTVWAEANCKLHTAEVTTKCAKIWSNSTGIEQEWLEQTEMSAKASPFHLHIALVSSVQGIQLSEDMFTEQSCTHWDRDPADCLPALTPSPLFGSTLALCWSLGISLSESQIKRTHLESR